VGTPAASVEVGVRGKAVAERPSPDRAYRVDEQGLVAGGAHRRFTAAGNDDRERRWHLVEGVARGEGDHRVAGNDASALGDDADLERRVDAWQGRQRLRGR
jgi:hypothetical protein